MRSISILLAGISCLATIPAYAEEVDDAEITVTGIRQAYRGDFDQKEIPQAIATIDSKQLEDNNILRLTDALDLNASVARQNTLGGLWDAFRFKKAPIEPISTLNMTIARVKRKHPAR